MVPHVPVCMYAHVRDGDMHIAERIKKKNWDQVGPGPVRLRKRERMGRLQIQTAGYTSAPMKINAPAGLLRPFLGNSKEEGRCTSDMI